MKLVEEGKLDLDAAMSDVLKDKLFPIRYQGKEICGYKAFCDGRINGKAGAAELLGLNANTLRNRMIKLGIDYKRTKNNQ